MLTATEKKISAFCARHGIRFEWQAMKYDTRRAVIATMDRTQYADVLKKARRLSGVRVSDWTACGSGVFDARVYIQDADAAAAADVRAAREKAHLDAWWTANHAARLAGMDPDAAGRYAESLHPTPAAF